MAARLKERYKEQIIAALMKEFSYKNTDGRAAGSRRSC